VPDSTFSACPGGGIPEPNLETAVNANASDGNADTVIVQAGYTYTDTGALTVNGGSDDLTVTGGGPTTVLTSSATGNGIVVDLVGTTRPSRFQDLTVRLPASFVDGPTGAAGQAVRLSNSTFQRVSFVTANPRSDGITAIFGSGAIEDSSFSSTGTGSFFSAIDVGGFMTGTFEIKGTLFDGVLNGVTASNTPGLVKISKSRIRLADTQAGRAVMDFGGTIQIRNSLIETPSGDPLTTQAGSSGIDAVIEADGVTLANRGGTADALTATAFNGSSDDASIVFNNSIANGYPEGYARLAGGAGTANISIDHSNIPATSFEQGPGTATRTNSIDADPLFTDLAAGNYSLLPGSPSRDAGDPASVLTDDFDSNPRPRDGDGNGSQIIDQGAFEAPTFIDTTPPDTFIDSGPAAGSTITTNSAGFAFHGTAGDTAKVQCDLDGGGYADCTSPKTFGSLSDGSHTVSFRAQDAVGNQDQTSATRTFTVDTTAPDTVIDSGPAAGSTITTNSASFGFHGFAGDTAKVQCKLDGAPYADCTSPKTFSSLSEGSHTVSFRAEDAVGNQDASPAIRTFTVDVAPPPDTTPPQTRIDSGPGSKAKKGIGSFSFSASEAASFECSLVMSGRAASFMSCASPRDFSIKRGKKTTGYVFSVRATDTAGNVDASPATKSFEVKKKPKKKH
jgi:hypothetical protein